MALSRFPPQLASRMRAALRATQLAALLGAASAAGPTASPSVTPTATPCLPSLYPELVGNPTFGTCGAPSLECWTVLDNPSYSVSCDGCLLSGKPPDGLSNVLPQEPFERNHTLRVNMSVSSPSESRTRTLLAPHARIL
jgi:hypothetical protein